MSTIELKNRVEQAISEELTAAERLSDDQAEVPALLGEGLIAVYVAPPVITFDTWAMRTTTFEVHLIHPVRDDETEAVTELLALVDRMVLEPWGVEDARPALYAGEYPEYIIKIEA